MNGIIEKQRSAELRNVKVRWLMLLGLAVLGAFSQMSLPDWIALGVLAAFGLVNEWAARDQARYENLGSHVITAVRSIDCAVWVSLSFSPTFRTDHLWLATVPVLMIEVTTRQRIRRLLSLSAIVTVTALVCWLGRAIPMSNFSVIVGSTAITAAFSYLVMGMSAREEKLQQHDRRFGAMISCSSALAGSRDLLSMLDQILRVAVEEVGGDSGYVMVVDEEDSNVLRTEVAFSATGDFDRPESLEIGEGLSGYVVQMSQPIALRNRDRQPVECDGIELGIRSVISVPLSSRVLIGPSESGQEQTLGALTVIGDPAGALFGPDEMELLCSMGSMMAVAVSNARMEGRQRTTFLRTLESLATALEARDDYTRGHSQRVCEVSMMLAEHLGFSPDAIEELRVGTILHDIGKIGVPDSVLNKPGRLTDEEFAIMKSHPVTGYEICKPLMLADGVLMIIRNHHEKLDGSGYPDHLKGGELPPSLRIVCVADAFDAMSSRRPYRGVMEIESVFAELSRCAGIQFDPVVVEALRELMPTQRMQDLYRQYWHQVAPKAA